MRGYLWIVGAAWLLLHPGPDLLADGGRTDDRRGGTAGGPPSSPEPSLRMSEAVVCRSIEGYEAYEPLPDAALTRDEKLLVYYRPLGYATAPVKDSYQAHFTQDAEIRRRGEKAILRQKKKLLDYTAKSPQPPSMIFLRNTISLKELKPGAYDLTLILHDEIAQGPPATQVVQFRVIPAQDPRKAAEPAPKDIPPAELDPPRRPRARRR